MASRLLVYFNETHVTKSLFSTFYYFCCGLRQFSYRHDCGFIFYVTRYEFKGKPLVGCYVEFPLGSGRSDWFFVSMLGRGERFICRTGGSLSLRALDPGLLHFWPLYGYLYFSISSRGADCRWGGDKVRL